jgi:hypothetical protein
MNNRWRTIKILLAGTGDSLFVNGQWYYGGYMPPLGAGFTNLEVASVLTYIRVMLNDSTVVSCDSTVLTGEGFATCERIPRSQAERNADTVAVWEAKFLRDSINAASMP